nr:odorant receptor 10 [Monochamus saltuarius]
MEYESNFLKLNKRAMLGIGIWPVNSSSVYPNFAYRIYNGILFVNYTTFLVTLVMGTKDTLHASPEEQAYVLEYLLSYAFLLWKIVLCQQESIRKLMRIISEKEKVIINCNDSGLKDIYGDGVKYNSNIFYLVLTIILTITLMFLLVVCVEVKSWFAYEEISNYTQSHKSLILPAAVPFDTEKHFKLIFCFQGIFRTYAAFVFLGCNTLLNSLIYFPAAYLKVLGYKFEHFGDESDNGLTSSEEILRSLILEHKEMIKYVDYLNDVLKWLLFFDFFIRSYHITLALMGIMSLLQNSEFNMEFISTFSFGMAYFGVLFIEMYCLYYSCNELIFESLEIPNCIFRSNWYEQPRGIQRSLLITMIRSQRPLEMKIGNLYTMNNDLIVGFVKAGFTYVSLSISNLDFQHD